MILNSFIASATLGCTIFLALLALSKKSNTPLGYRFLSVFFVLISIVLADELLDNFGIYQQHPVLLIFFQPLLYTVAPVIYFSVLHLTIPGKKIGPPFFIHFVPYLLIVCLYIVAYFSNQANQGVSPGQVETADEKWLEIFLQTLFFIQLFIYLFFSSKQLARHHLTLPFFVSSIPDNDYHWLFKTFLGICVLLLTSLVEVFFIEMHISFYFSFIYLVGFYYVGIQLSKQKEVFPFSQDHMQSVAALINDQQHPSVNASVEESEFVPGPAESDEAKLIEKKKVISEEKMAYYKEQLLELMEKDKPYLDSEITLPKLGQMLGLNTYQTSYLINNCFEENFYTFINRYRLEACKKMLISPQYTHLSILGIAFQAGFSSKTAFNTFFKKTTGLSPKDYKEQMKKENQ